MVYGLGVICILYPREKPTELTFAPFPYVIPLWGYRDDPVRRQPNIASTPSMTRWTPCLHQPKFR